MPWKATTGTNTGGRAERVLLGVGGGGGWLHHGRGRRLLLLLQLLGRRTQAHLRELASELLYTGGSS